MISMAALCARRIRKARSSRAPRRRPGSRASRVKISCRTSRVSFSSRVKLSRNANNAWACSSYSRSRSGAAGIASATMTRLAWGFVYSILALFRRDSPYPIAEGNIGGAPVRSDMAAIILFVPSDGIQKEFIFGPEIAVGLTADDIVGESGNKFGRERVELIGIFAVSKAIALQGAGEQRFVRIYLRNGRFPRHVAECGQHDDGEKLMTDEKHRKGVAPPVRLIQRVRAGGDFFRENPFRSSIENAVQLHAVQMDII